MPRPGVPRLPGSPAGIGGRSAAERRARVRGRPRLRRRRRLRRGADPHAARRPAGRRGRALHRLLRGAGGVLGVARGAPHRRLPEPRRHPGCPLPHLDERHRRGRDDARRGAEGPRVRDGDLRQVAPRAPAAVPPDAPRLRRLLRPALLQRHVAEPPGADEVPAAAPLLAGRRADHQPRPVAAHRRVRAARGGLHRENTASAPSSSTSPTRCRTCRSSRPGASAGARGRASTATWSRRSTGRSGRCWRRFVDSGSSATRW